MAATQKGAIFTAEGGIQKSILAFIKQALAKGCFDAVLIPARVSAGDSFSYSLIQDESLLENTSPLPPIMPVQGARAVSSLTRRGKGKKKIAAILRPCEAMAAIELGKLKQLELENIILITVDCPGVIPLFNYFNNPEKGDKTFEDASQSWNSDPMRTVCTICDRFSAIGGEDLHIGTLGTKSDSIFLMPGNSKGENILNELGISLEEDISGWEDKVNKLTEERKKARSQANAAIKTDIEGIDRLTQAFSTCINCHNCMRVCPICYCRQCNFDSDKMKFPFEDYLTRAEGRNGLLVPTDTLLFHIGRMLHISLSCVSCGMCEDACPMDIPVAQIFSMVSDENQALFDYVPGRSLDEPLPLTTFKESEFLEVEQSYTGVSAKQEDQDA